MIRLPPTTQMVHTDTSRVQLGLVSLKHLGRGCHEDLLVDGSRLKVLHMGVQQHILGGVVDGVVRVHHRVRDKVGLGWCEVALLVDCEAVVQVPLGEIKLVLYIFQHGPLEVVGQNGVGCL